MYIDCGSTSGSRVMKPTAIFCAKKPFLVNWFSRVSDLIIPNGNPPIVTISSFSRSVLDTAQLFLKHPNYFVLGRNFLYFMVHLCSRPSGRSQVAGSFQPNSSTNSAICQGWESQRHFSQHVQDDEEFNFNFQSSTAALLDWLYSRKTGSLPKAGGDQDIYKLS